MSYLYKDTIDKIKQLKLFIYLRRSSKDNEDRQIRSIPGQLHDLEEQIIKKYNLNNNILKIYKESRSAFESGREDFNDMLGRIERGEGDGIIVWHPNRLARNYGDGGRLVQLMSESKIKMVLTLHSIFENNARDKEYLMTEFTRATRDSDDKSEAVKRGNKERFFERKQWIGPAKQGYLNYVDPISKEKLIKIDNKRFPVIQKAFKLILSGSYTPMEVLNKLNNEWGYRTRKTKRQGGNPMSKSSFYKLLSDPFYYGLMVRREGKQMGNHKPMLAEEEFNRLQIILGRKGKPHITKHEFAFKEILRCGECKGSITCEEKWQIICPVCKTKFNKGKQVEKCSNCKTLIDQMKNPKILHYIYYHCTKRVNKNCSQGSIALNKLEQQADNELKRYKISEQLKDWAIKYLNELNETETKDRESIRRNLINAENDCVKCLDNLVRLKISPQNSEGSLLPDNEYNIQRKEILLEKESIARQLKKIDQRINKWHELSVNTFNFACYARYWFAKGDLKTKTQILAALGSNLVIKDRNLSIDGQKQWFLIEKGKQELEILAKTFEPVKWLELLGKKDLPEAFRSCWLGN